MGVDPRACGFHDGARPLKVVHLSTFDFVGGAARAAAGLHHALGKIGVASSMLTRERTTDQPGIIEAPRVRHPVSAFWYWLQRNCIDKNRTDLSNTYFSLGHPGPRLAEVPSVRDADILNLHWVTGFQSPRDLGALIQLGKPVVWTLHDQRAYTGGCHFSAGCTRFRTDCNPCPQLAEDRAAITVRNLKDQYELGRQGQVVAIAPSRWMAEEAKSSLVLSDARVEVIPNGIDTAVFRPIPKMEARRLLGLSEDGFCILFGVDSGGEKRKGANELLAAIKQLLETKRANIQVLCFGQPHPGFLELGSAVRSLGYLKSAEELRQAYAAADVFVLPSLEDNLPTTMLEALGCGTPVVAFATGGIPDVVDDGVNGRLVPNGDEAGLADVLSDLAQTPDACARMGKTGADLIAAQYSLERQARDYLKLYQSLEPQKRGRQSVQKTGQHLRAAIPSLCLQAVRREFKDLVSSRRNDDV